MMMPILKMSYLKSSSILDLLLFLSTLEELWRDLGPGIRDPKGMAPTPMAPMGPMEAAAMEAPRVGCGLAPG